MDKIEKVARAITIADGCDPDAMGCALTEKTRNELGESYPLWKTRIKQAKAAIFAVTSGD